MPQSRITDYDGKNVTFRHQRYEDNKKVSATLSAFDFIKRLFIFLNNLLIYSATMVHMLNHSLLYPIFVVA